MAGRSSHRRFDPAQGQSRSKEFWRKCPMIEPVMFKVEIVPKDYEEGGPTDKTLANRLTDLIVQRNELSSIPQSLFPGPAVAVAGKSIPLLPPFGQIDYMPLWLRGEFGGEY